MRRFLSVHAVRASQAGSQPACLLAGLLYCLLTCLAQQCPLSDWLCPAGIPAVPAITATAGGVTTATVTFSSVFTAVSYQLVAKKNGEVQEDAGRTVTSAGTETFTLAPGVWTFDLSSTNINGDTKGVATTPNLVVGLPEAVSITSAQGSVGKVTLDFR